MKRLQSQVILSPLGFLLIFFLSPLAEGVTLPLTMDSALALIGGSKEFLKMKTPLPLHSEGFQKGMNQGYWSGGTIMQGGSPIFSQLDVKITEKGKEIFSEINFTEDGRTFVTLVLPHQTSLKIQTLNDENTDSNTVIAKFTWEYHQIPSQAKRFVVKGGNGIAAFTPSLEGWIITDLELNLSEIPIPLTFEERSLEKKDIQKQQEIQRLEEEKKKAIRQKYRSFIRESKTPTEEIDQLEFKFSIVHPSTSLKREYHFIAKITDVHLRVQGTEKTGTTEAEYVYAFWFYDIEDISMGYNQEDNLHWVEIKNIFGKKALWGSENKHDILRAYNILETAKRNWDDKFRDAIQKNPFAIP